MGRYWDWKKRYLSKQLSWKVINHDKRNTVNKNYTVYEVECYQLL